LLKTYRSARQIRDVNAFRPWLYRVVRNACLVGRRKRAHEPPRFESLEGPADEQDAGERSVFAAPGRDPEQLTEDNRRRRQLRAALGALPRAYRIVLFLRDMEGLSTREVSRVLGISEDNVKTRLRRARGALQSKLEATTSGSTGRGVNRRG
jgi:RNA polymerase sigma-70 factor (ECF subfamily)